MNVSLHWERNPFCCFTAYPYELSVPAADVPSAMYVIKPVISGDKLGTYTNPEVATMPIRLLPIFAKSLTS